MSRLSDDYLNAIRATGAQREAAALAEQRGEWRAAVALLAEVWEHDSAITLALAQGALDEAFRVALGALDRGLASSLVPRFAEAPVDQTRRAAELARRKGRLSDAARLLELAGDATEAARVFAEVGEHVEAGRLLEAEGRLREAGLAYEQALLETPESGAVALSLGRILVHFQRWEHAVALLQRAARDPRDRGAAWRFLVLCFDALGLSYAAARSLDRLRSGDPTLPATVAQYLAESFGAVAGGRLPPVRASDAKSETESSASTEQIGQGADDLGALLAGRYRVIRPLGAGSTGRVVLARDVLFDRDVAVKILTVAGGSAAGRDAYARFAREARISGGMSHPSIVAVHGYEPAGPLLVLEHLSGGTLADRLAPGQPLAADLIRRVGRSILEALGAVHRRGVVHRDLKPANVFFGASGEVKLGDFGVAHLTDLGATLTGALLGSFATMAPEQITGDTPTGATDLYAFGVVLFQMLTGRLPFDGPDLLTDHLETTPKTPSAVRCGVPPAFDGFVTRLLEKSPDRRPRSAAEALAGFEALPWDSLPSVANDPGPPQLSMPGLAEVSESNMSDAGPRFEDRGEGRLRDRYLERTLRLIRVTPVPEVTPGPPGSDITDDTPGSDGSVPDPDGSVASGPEINPGQQVTPGRAPDPDGSVASGPEINPGQEVTPGRAPGRHVTPGWAEIPTGHPEITPGPDCGGDGGALVERYLAFARADVPSVQGVIEVVSTAGEVLLEDLGEGGGVVVEGRDRSILLEALRGLHRAGIVHGEIGPDRLARSPAGAPIWLLPRQLPATDLGPDADLEAFERFW